MSRKVVIEFLGDSKDLQRAMGDADSKGSRLQGTLGKVGKAAAFGLGVGLAAAAKGLYDATGNASDLSETLSKTDNVFGKSATGVINWSKDSARSLGLSQQAALAFTSQFGDMFVQLGAGQKEAAKTSQGIVKLATDLGSFHNLGTDEVLDKISGAMRGEYDSIQKIIPGLSDARVKQQALTDTGKTSVDQLTEQEKAMAALAIITKDGATAHNDFAETSGGLANQQKILKAQLQNTSAEIGMKLLPAAAAVATWFNDKALPAAKAFGGWLGDHLPPIFERIRSVVSTVMNAVQGDVGGGLGRVRQIFTDVTSIITSLWNRFGGTLTDYAQKTFANMKQVIGGALTVIQGIFQTFSALLKGDWSGVWDGIKKILSGAFEVIKGIVKQALNVVGTLMQVGWSAVKGIVGAAWDGIKTAVSNGVDNVVDLLRNKVGGFKSAGGALIGAFVDGMKSAGGVIEGIAGNVWTAVRSLLNAAIDKINAALEFTITLPGPDLTINPSNIPHMAKGGLVTRPTLALIGEDGPEAVVPLSRKHNPGGVMPGMGGGGAVSTIVQLVLPGGKVIEQLLIQHQRDTGRPLQVSTLGPA